MKKEEEIIQKIIELLKGKTVNEAIDILYRIKLELKKTTVV